MEEYDETLDQTHEWPLNGSKFLAIITENGRLILEPKPYLSLIKLIEYVGIDSVASLELKGKDELPLVSKTRWTTRDYQPASDGWFVYTDMNTKGKVAIIERIGELIGQKFVCATKIIY